MPISSWDYEPIGTFYRNQGRLDEEEERRLYQLERAETQFQPNLLQQGLEKLSLPGRMIRGALQGAFLPPPPGVGQFEQALAGGLLGAVGEEAGTRLQPSGAGILERQLGVPAGPGFDTPFGPLNARGVAGFGLDVVTDPLSLLPIERLASGVGGFARRGLGRLPPVAGYVPHAAGGFTGLPEVLQEAANPTPMKAAAGFLGEHLPGFKQAAGLVSPRLVAQTDEETLRAGYRVAQSLVENQVNEWSAPFVANKTVREITQAGGLVDGVPWNDALARHGAGFGPEVQALAKQVARHDADLDALYSGTFNDLVASGAPADLVKVFERKPSHVRRGEQFIGRRLVSEAEEPLGTSGMVGGRVGIQERQKYKDVASALKAGHENFGIEDTLRIREAETFRKVLEMQMAMALGKAAVPAGAPMRGVAFAKGLLFEPETAKRMGSFLREGENEALRLAADVASFPRAIQTNYDLGGAFIQGVVSLANRPGEWLASNMLSLRVLGDPAVHARLMASDMARDVARTFPTLPLNRALREMEGATPSSLFGRALEKVPGPAGVAWREATHRLGTVFEMQNDARMIYAGQAWLPHVRAHPEDAMKIADFIAHTNSMAPRALEGVSRNQQNLERTVFFASGYLASSFALMGDVLQGGIVGREAAKSLANMLVVGLVGYRQITQALGQPPIMNPADSRFMTVDVGGTRIGIGSIWTALARSFGQVWDKAEKVATGQAAPPGPEHFFGMEALDNPFLRFFRGRASTPAGWFLDVVNNETYLGQPIRSPGEALLEAGKRSLPFTLVGAGEAAVRGQGFGDVAAQAGAGAIGLRNFPESYADIRSEVSQQKFKKDYPLLNEIERAQVRADPRIKNRPIPPSARYEGTRAKENIYGTFEQEVNLAAGQVGTGEITKDQFRVRVSAAQADKQRLLAAQPEPAERRLSAPEKALRGYFEILRDTGQYRRTNWDLADTYLEGLPPQHQRYIEDRLRAGYEYLSPEANRLMNELRTARDVLKEYRAIPKQVMAQQGIWEEYAAPTTTPKHREEMEDTYRYKLAHRIWTRQQEYLRRRQPEIDRALVDWYGNKPILERRR